MKYFDDAVWKEYKIDLDKSVVETLKIRNESLEKETVGVD